MRDQNGFCECAEAFVGYHRIVPPKWHDCKYIALRNRGLNDACRIADSQVRGMPDKTPEERVAKLAERARVISREMDIFGAWVLAGMASSNKNNNNNASVSSREGVIDYVGL